MCNGWCPLPPTAMPTHWCRGGERRPRLPHRAESCFFNEVYVSPELKQFSWQGLYNLIKGRKDTPTEGSYTTYLFEKGKEKILKKVGEECTEVIIAGEKEDKAERSTRSATLPIMCWC